MPTSLIIVDDFLDQAQALREAALNLTYPPQSAMYPGRNSTEKINLEGLDDQVSRLVGEPLRAIGPPQSHGNFRLTMAADRGAARVHIDKAHWSGILYLSRPQDCLGGTEFFRHIETGLERIPMNAVELKASGFSHASQVGTGLVDRDSNDPNKWELVMRVPMRFNRLLLLRPWLFHTAGENFGDRPENARLVYLMFFESARA